MNGLDSICIFRTNSDQAARVVFHAVRAAGFRFVDRRGDMPERGEVVLKYTPGGRRVVGWAKPLQEAQ